MTVVGAGQCGDRGNQDAYRSGDDGIGDNDFGYVAIVGRCHVCRYGGDDYGRSVRFDHPDHLRASGDLLYILLRLNRYNEYEK